jgi:hypothetical protein
MTGHVLGHSAWGARYSLNHADKTTLSVTPRYSALAHGIPKVASILSSGHLTSHSFKVFSPEEHRTKNSPRSYAFSRRSSRLWYPPLDRSSRSSFQLELSSASSNLDFGQILGKQITIALLLPAGQSQYLNGVITSFSQGAHSQNGSNAYFAQIEPWFALSWV